MKDSNILHSQKRKNQTILPLLRFANILGIIVISLIIFSACNDDEVFEKEQYKNVFALISEDDNVSRKFHRLGEESIGYVAASLGGTNPTTKDIVVNLVEDETLIDKFNLTNYDVDLTKYIRSLPKDKYDIESLQFTIKAGEIGSRLPIRIRPDGLSPDSAYFIALRVESYSSYEVNPDKDYVLYRVRIKNSWAKADGSTLYTMRAKQKKDSSSEIEMPGSKVMYPLTKNSVRIMAGNETFSANKAVFYKSAIILEVGDDNKVNIRPYGGINVTQIDGDKDFPNTFKIEDDGFKTYKTFLLRYNYVLGNSSYQMKEELRLEFNEDDETEL